MSILPRSPIALAPAFRDPGFVQRAIDEHSPYWPVQRYFANSAEYAALSGKSDAAPMIVAPVFRGNWATEGVPLPGLEPLFQHQPFIDAARRLFDAEIVRPQNVYVNLTWQLPFPQGKGHTDVPAFRGFDRSRYPITFLSADGGFEYWQQGPDRPPIVHEGAIDNTCIVGDNDFMWHRVRPTGRVEDGMLQLTLNSELVRHGAEWAIVDDGRTLASFPRQRLRVSVSWKAIVFESEQDRRRYDEHSHDIDLAGVLHRFAHDLQRRRVDFALPRDPLRDADWIRLLQETYVRAPAVFAPA
jgi:hypothetical protein